MIIDYEDDGVIRWEWNGEKKHTELIELIEAYEDKRKHGRWIKDNGLYKCSVCNNFTITGWDIPIEQMNKTMKYGNNCGAKMDL
jgi:hypothetical protein